MWLFAYLIAFLTCTHVFAGDNPKEQKILICGVAKDVKYCVKHDIKNIETLGEFFDDYAVIIYENNSSDETVESFKKWAKKNPKVTFISENVSKKNLPATREEKIARARNIVLSKAKDPKYKDFKYLIMADLDFRSPWPLNEILETIKSPIEWDCVSANGLIWENRIYLDRYAFRDQRFPFGIELIGDDFWKETLDPKSPCTWFTLEGAEWVPTYSAFGGLAIYKKDVILQYSYSGTVTEDLKHYYEKIISALPKTNIHLQKYVKQINVNSDADNIPVVFKKDGSGKMPVCCEHVPLHASMAMNGHGKFYVNPRMVMYYQY